MRLFAQRSRNEGALSRGKVRAYDRSCKEQYRPTALAVFVSAAGPVKGGTTVIAFVQDPDGYKVRAVVLPLPSSSLSRHVPPFSTAADRAHPGWDAHRVD